MLATAATTAPQGDDWSFEIKLDGLRTLAVVRDGEATLWSRNGIDVTSRFPEVASELAELPAGDVVFDGEIVVAGQDGVPSFELAMERFQAKGGEADRLSGSMPAEYVLFDIVSAAGWNVQGCRFADRRQMLERTIVKSGHVRPIDSFDGDGGAVLEQAIRLGFEGIVAKRKDSVYRPGKRSSDWLKVKPVQTEDLLVAGWTDGEGSRAKTFGSLVLARPDAGRLVHAGNVGSGFDETTARDVLALLAPDERQDSPLSDPPASSRVHWVEPRHWAEVKFMKHTSGKKLRIPSFVRMRPDKDAPLDSAELDTPQSHAPTGSADVLDALDAGENTVELQVAGGPLRLTSLDKVIWPATEGRGPLTKRDLIRYYVDVAPFMLPHLEDRPLTLIRLPDGLEGERILQKHYPHRMPPFVETVDIWSESNQKPGSYILCNNVWTLVWLGQIGTVEIHPWFSRTKPDPGSKLHGTDLTSSEEAIDASVLNYPDYVVFDLDPYVYSGKEAPGAEPEPSPEAFKATVKTARMLKQLTDSIGLQVFLKTSGKTGLHAFLPVRRDVPYETTRGIASTLGQELVASAPKEVTIEWAVKKRPGKVFFDFNMNARGKTLASVYSPRALQGAPVSCPVDWSQLGRVVPERFNLETVPKRLAKDGDLWADLYASRQDLTALLKGNLVPKTGKT